MEPQGNLITAHTGAWSLPPSRPRPTRSIPASTRARQDQRIRECDRAASRDRDRKGHVNRPRKNTFADPETDAGSRRSTPDPSIVESYGEAPVGSTHRRPGPGRGNVDISGSDVIVAGQMTGTPAAFTPRRVRSAASCNARGFTITFELLCPVQIGLLALRVFSRGDIKDDACRRHEENSPGWGTSH